MAILKRPLRGCYFGTYRANYVRNQIMIEGLRHNDVEVVECQETLWRGGGGRIGSRQPVAGIILFAVIKIITVADPDNVYVRANDLRAMEWIRTHTDTSAKFLINPVIFGWSPGAVTGNDAGYWLPLLTGRQTTILPMVVPVERVDANTLAVMSELSEMVTSPNAATLSTLKREGVSHVFIGERGGPIPVSLLENTDCVAEVWRRGRTRVFQIDYGCIE